MRAVRVATLEEVCHYGRTLPRGLVAPIAGAAAPALDHDLGAGASLTAPVSHTLTSAVASGELMIAYASANDAVVGDGILVTDSKSNAWNTLVGTTALTGGPLGIAGTTTKGALTASDSVTAAESGTPAGIAIGAASFTGAIQQPYGTNTASFTTTAITITTSVAANAGDLILAMVAVTGGTATLAQPGGWTPLSSATVGTGAVAYTIFCAYHVTASLNFNTYAPTLTDSTMTRANMAIVVLPAWRPEPFVYKQAVRTMER